MDLEQRVDEFFRHAAAADASALVAMCRPDAVVAQNIGEPGPASNLFELVAGLAAAGITVRYSNVRRVVGRDAVTEQHVVTMTRPDGVAASGDVCVVLRFDADGAISRIDEYLDPSPFVAILT